MGNNRSGGKRGEPFRRMASELQRVASRAPVIELDAERAKRAGGEADRLIARLIDQDGGLIPVWTETDPKGEVLPGGRIHSSRLALFVSEEFRRVAAAAFSSEAPEAATKRLGVILNILTDYTAREAREAVSLRAIYRGMPEAADLIEQAAEALKDAEGLNRPARSPGGRWYADVFNPDRIPELARNGGLIFALKVLAQALRSAPLSQTAAAPRSAIPGASLAHLPKSGPAIYQEPHTTTAGHMARNLHAALPPGVADPFATIAALLRLTGVETTRQKVAQAVNTRAPK